MPIDLTILAPEARVRYIRLGRQWSPASMLAQANQTLHGVALHGADIAKHGFSAQDGVRLTDVRDALVVAGVDRSDARGDKKVNSATYAESVALGKATRDSARAILTSTRGALLEKGSPSAKAGVKAIDAALQETRVADDDAGKLATKLDVLRGVLGDANVAPEAAGRGGTEAVADLQGAADALRAASAGRAAAPGTPAETEQINLLGGIAVTLARNAFKAARAAAKRLGKPAIVADFELTKLYGPRHDTADATTNDAPATTNGAAANTGATPAANTGTMPSAPAHG